MPSQAKQVHVASKWPIVLLGVVLATCAVMAFIDVSSSPQEAAPASGTRLATGTKLNSGCPFGGSSAPCAEASFLSTANPPLSPSQYVTSMGCKCSGSCGTSVTNSFGRCDWCRTQDGCGQGGFLTGGSWDYCKYAPPMSAFEMQDAATKQSQLWEHMTAPGAVGKSASPKSKFSVLTQMLSESMITTFDDQWEVLPKGRSKVIHTQGAHCQFTLEVSSDKYTGLLAKGKSNGIIRMGAAANLDGGTMFPGLGIKFLRTGVKSANFVALRATGPGGSHNFFATMISNHVAPPPNAVLEKKFQQASGCIDMVGLSDVASYGQDGKKVVMPDFPFELQFEATDTAKKTNGDSTKSNDSLLKALSNIPSGTKLFDVYAFASPADKKAGKRTLLGSLSTASRCVQSTFGDTQLFFRHQRMEEDFAKKPDWIQQMPALQDDLCKATTGPVSKWQCPAQ